MKVSREVIKLLRVTKKLLPNLDKNLHITHSLYMEGKLAKGAFDYMLSRHDNAYLACNIINLRNGDINPEVSGEIKTDDIEMFEKRLINIATWVLKDLSVHVKEDLNSPKQAKEKLRVEDLLNELDSALNEMGYTEIHPLFKIKMLKTNVEIAER